MSVSFRSPAVRLTVFMRSCNCIHWANKWLIDWLIDWLMMQKTRFTSTSSSCAQDQVTTSLTANPGIVRCARLYPRVAMSPWYGHLLAMTSHSSVSGSQPMTCWHWRWRSRWRHTMNLSVILLAYLLASAFCRPDFWYFCIVNSVF